MAENASHLSSYSELRRCCQQRQALSIIHNLTIAMVRQKTKNGENTEHEIWLRPL